VGTTTNSANPASSLVAEGGNIIFGLVFPNTYFFTRNDNSTSYAKGNGNGWRTRGIFKGILEQTLGRCFDNALGWDI